MADHNNANGEDVVERHEHASAAPACVFKVKKLSEKAVLPSRGSPLPAGHERASAAPACVFKVKKLPLSAGYDLSSSDQGSSERKSSAAHRFLALQCPKELTRESPEIGAGVEALDRCRSQGGRC